MKIKSKKLFQNKHYQDQEYKIDWAIFWESIKKPLAFLLAVFIFLQPVAVVFAQEAASSSDTTTNAAAPTTTTTTTSDTTLPPTSPAPDTTTVTPPPATPPSSADTPSVAPAPDSSVNAAPLQPLVQPTPKPTGTTPPPLSGSSDQYIINPKFPTLDQRLAHTDEHTGAAISDYPIVVPPGRNGMQPDLTLSYNSQSTEDGSVFGFGWSISIPYIERINKIGAKKFYSTTSPVFFNSSIDGELATTSATSTYIARVDNGSFHAYTFSNNQWSMTDKNGTQYKFGYATSTEQNDSTSTNHVYKWMLEEIRDKNDNYIKYTYYKDGGQIYPASIYYTGTSTVDGIFRVDFARESRVDTFPSYKAGFPVVSHYRINQIKTYVNSVQVRQYDLNYTTGNNGVRSLLHSITETGYAAGSPTALPATTYTYQTTNTGFATSAFSLPSDPLIGFSLGDKMIDVNGDGLVDYLSSWTGPNINGHTSNNEVYLQQPDGTWVLSTTYVIPVTFYNGTSYSNVAIGDFNGDGKMDMAYSQDANNDGIVETQNVYINNGSNWVLDSNWNFPLPLATGNVNNTIALKDLNGDGLPDMYNQDTGSSVYFNTGSSFATATPDFIAPASPPLAWLTEDINNDGMMDLLKSSLADAGVCSSRDQAARLNDASSSFPSFPSSTPPILFVGSNTCTPVPRGVITTDIDGDGLPDILQATTYGTTTQDAYANTGQGWVQKTNWKPDSSISFYHGSAYSNTIVTDLNGDGLPDILDNGTGWINGNKKADLLTSITYNTGGKTDIYYKPTPQYASSTANVLLNPALPLTIYTVNQIVNNDGTATSTTDTYTYSGGKYFWNSSLDRKFAGFSEIDKTDLAGNVTKTFYHTGTGTDSAHGEYQDDYWKIGKPYRVEKYDASKNLFEKTINKWDVATSTQAAGFVKLAQTVTSAYDGQSTHKDKAESYTYNNSTGDPTQKVEYGQVTGSDDGTFSDTGTDDFTTNFTYATSSTTSIMSLLATSSTLDHSSSKVKETRNYYDNYARGIVDKGNLTKQDNWKTGSTYINSQKAYNSYGLPTTSTDPRGKTTSFTYDSYNLYPTTVTQPLSLVTSYAYDYSSGKVATTTDPNGNIFVSVYDGLNRLTEQKQPDPAATSTLQDLLTYTYTDTANAVNVKQTKYLSATSSVDAYTYFDGLNRPIQSRKMAKAGNYEVKDIAYNNLGLLQKETLPYFSSGSGTTTATSTTALYINYAYDPLQRIVTTSNTLGTTTNAYLNWKTTITDPNGKTKDLLSDAYGNLIEVDEHNASSTYVTTYTYNRLGNVLSITDALSNVRNFTYDGLGRRLTAQDLHASGDGTYGSYSYTYDDSGNQTQVVDPKSQTINYTFDDINRPLTEDFTSATGTEVTYTYDSCTQGKTRLCTASSTAVNIADVYNALGQLTQETKTIDATAYVTAYTYDRQGNELTITNPDNSQVKYLYGTGGLLDQVQRKESTDSGFTSVVTGFDYAPNEQIASSTFANGVTVVNTLDPTKLYRLTRKLSTLPSSSKAQDINYTYDAAGNITQIVNSSQTNASSSLAYVYDDLYRLTSATATSTPNGISGYTNTYTYDAIGNILSRTESGTTTNYSYLGNLGSNYANPDAVTAFTGGSSASSSSITLDATSTSITNGYNSTITKTWTHTISSGSNRLLVLSADLWQDVAGTGSITSASYNGAALTKATSTLSTGMESEIWYLVNPSSGAHTVSVTVTGDTDAIKLNASTFTGAAQSSALDVSSTAIGTSGNPSISATTATANDAIVATLSRYSTTDATTSRTSLYKDITGSTFGAASYQVATSTGSYSDTYTGSAGQDWSMVMAGFKPNTTTSSVATTSSFTYDNNGNMLTASSTILSTNTWDYNNRLTQVVSNSATSTYAYDPSGQRVKMTVATTSSATTYFPTKFYNITGATATKHIFTPGGLLLATIQPGSSATSSGSIALDATSTSITNAFNNTITKTWTHTTSSGSNRLLVLSADIWQDVAGSGSISSASYNGTSLTKATSTLSGGMDAETWYLANPSSGSNTVSVTVTGDTDAIKLNAATFTGITQSSPIDANATATGGSGNPSVSLTTATANDLIVATLSRYSTTGATSNRTSLYNDITGSTLGASSYQLATSTGSYTDTYTGSVGQDWSMVATGFKIASSASTSTTTVSYILTDHLGGTNVITDSSGSVINELLDYYPYGGSRLDAVSGIASEARKFIGQESDSSTGLDYLNARYYNATYGKFLSQDPVFLAIGDANQVKQLTNEQLQQFLVNPQSLNSYSYALDNPLINTDPTGNLNWNVLFSPIGYAGALAQEGGWFVSSLGMNWTGHPLTGALMQHALTLGPGPVTINSHNQGSWGNAINQIEGSSDFKNSVNGYLAADGKNGSIDQTYTSQTDQKTVEFNSGDLKTGVHGTYSTSVKGTQNTNGTWNLNVTITDQYDYTNQSYNGSEGSKALTGINNAANFSQGQGVISNYGVTFNFSIPNYNPNQKK